MTGVNSHYNRFSQLIFFSALDGQSIIIIIILSGCRCLDDYACRFSRSPVVSLLHSYGPTDQLQ